ncbi:glycosyltransferase family 2 protein [Glutamicibacter uratoxydans]|uniref:glycosyltransferase family 2 protein n=1 Tax=Glutamicibacter uratoxydans TaxID=43667 RepID=UPI003D6E3313
MIGLSVVIPVLNDQAHLKNLLQALALQTYQPQQIIVVDNGSTDHSAELAHSTAGTTVIFEPRPGIASASAAGYNQAHEAVIVRCDADTLPDAQWLERIAARFAEDPELDALTGPGYFTDLPRWARSIGSGFYAAAYFGGFGAALARVPLWGSNMAFRRELWAQVEPNLHLDEAALHDDLDISCNLPDSVRVVFDARLRVRAAGRVFLRDGALRDSMSRAWRTLQANGGRELIFRRWHTRLGLPSGR